MNCHSQLVRFTEDDVRRFGPASEAWESGADAPQLWGTRRVGPDLAREGGRKSRDWQLAHLWNPRLVVPDSVMPRYPWLFDGSPMRPRREALDVVNYLESLGRDARLAGLSGPGPLSGRDPEEESGSGCSATAPFPGPPGCPGLGYHAGRRRERTLRPQGGRGLRPQLRGCHGKDGLGDGPAAAALTPVPRNLATALFSDRSLSESLWNGVRGSSMPSWSDLPSGELRGLVAYLKTIAPTEQQADLTAQERATGKALFVKQCAVCHGQTGAGDGPTAAILAPAPTNFHKVRPTVEYAGAALSNGVRGTAMPRWGPKLTPDEALAVGPLRAVVLWHGNSGVT